VLLGEGRGLVVPPDDWPEERLPALLSLRRLKILMVAASIGDLRANEGGKR
jgi:hypothetical protein